MSKFRRYPTAAVSGQVQIMVGLLFSGFIFNLKIIKSGWCFTEHV